MANDTVEQFSAVVANVPQAKKPPLVKRLSEQGDVAKKILEQIDQRLAGAHSIPERIVSLHDPEARPIRRGKLAKPNEFGRTMQLMQDQSGLILDYEIQHGNPNDKTKLIPQVKRFIKLFGRPPSQIAADKGYYSPENIAGLRKLRVGRVGIAKIRRLKPRQRRRQHSRWFKILQRFHCGMEATISMLKRCCMLGDICVRGFTATALWVGWSIFSFNLGNFS